MHDIDKANELKIGVRVTPLFANFFFNELIDLINNSKLSIHSIQYQWRWNIHDRHSKIAQLGDAISRARARGVEVYVILNEEAPRRNISKINQVSGNRLRELGCQVKNLKHRALLHTKMWVIDGKYSLVGSHNISTRSLTANEEVSVKIISKDVARLMKSYFDRLWD